MIWFMMGLGGIAVLTGLFLILYVAASPLIVRLRNISGVVELQNTGAVKKSRQADRKFLFSLGIGCVLLGALLILAGWAWGFNRQGDGFWLNRYLSGEQGISDKWDRISESGSFIAEDGTEYPYYLLIQGNTYEFSGEVCADIEDVQEQLTKMKRENTVMLIDSFAVSSKIKEAEKMLKEMGIKYEMEEV